MATKVLRGSVTTGCGDASNWGIEDIRRVTCRDNLHKGTLNVKLNAPHKLRTDYKLDKKDRTDRRNEDLCFECCWLNTSTAKVPAFIARTSTNHWGDEVLEIMAEWVEGVGPGDSVTVEVCLD